MPSENSWLKNVIGEIETVRMKRQQEPADRSVSSWKRFTQQELNDEVCPTYKNLLLGRSRRIPNRETIIRIAEYLECTSDERNDLLLAAGYLPIRTELEGRALELELERAHRTLSMLPFPAMIVTHTQDIKGCNVPFRRLFDLAPDRSYDGLMNRIDLHFHSSSPIRERSTFDAQSRKQWESHAIYGIQSFKRDHMLSRYDAWYQRVIHKAQTYKAIERYGHPPNREEVPDNTQTILATMESTGELVPVRYKTFSISASGYIYPKIEVFLPADASARKVFEDLGCPANCEFG